MWEGVHVKAIRLLSLFSGIGAFEQALKNEKLNYKLRNYCEIDKFASRSYSAIHDVSEDMNLWDVRKVDGTKFNDIDLLTHGSPCQDFTSVGKGVGGDEDSGTRSSLMWETVRIVKECKPKFILWEQVPAVLHKNHVHNFNKYLTELENIGYNNNYQMLNAKDFGVPQNRSRVFTLSIRQDIDSKIFVFPNPIALKLMLKSILEKNVLSKYYLSDKLIECFSSMKNRNGFVRGRYFKPLSPESSHARTIRTRTGSCPTNNYVYVKDQKTGSIKGIRNITPLESWRLMGFNDEAFYKAKNAGISDTQLYKQAGNSIVVPVLEQIYKEIMKLNLF